MKIEEYEIKKWTEEFNDIRRILQTSADFVCWCIPTKRILNLLPPIVANTTGNTWLSSVSMMAFVISTATEKKAWSPHSMTSNSPTAHPSESKWNNEINIC